MTNKQYEIIMEAKENMENKGFKGVQFIKIEDEKAIFEASGDRKDEYINYTVDLINAEENEFITIKKTLILVLEEEGEVQVSICVTKWDDDFNESYQDKEIKIYKRMTSAVKKAEELVSQITGSYMSIARV